MPELSRRRGDLRMNVKNTVIPALVLVLLSLGVAAYISLGGGSKEPSETVAAVGTPTPKLTPAPTPVPTQKVTPVATPQVTPEPTPGLPDVDIMSWELRLVNEDRPIDPDFAPEIEEIEDWQFFDARAAQPLKDFIAGAREAGNETILLSSYRAYAEQEFLFDQQLRERQRAGLKGDAAYAAAARVVAIPGASEHQLGLAADIVDKYYKSMNESLAATELSKWMKEHSAEYGFILRYPEDKQEITKIMFEPWHYRYVGVEAAEYIMEHGLCLEEFVALYES